MESLLKLMLDNMHKEKSNGWCKLPEGRILYTSADIFRYVLVSCAKLTGYWITKDGWSTGDDAAGPFQPTDALRAYRLANTMVPDGCELGPWQTGIGLFDLTKLPGNAGDWLFVEPNWLPPSITKYTISDIAEIQERTCCAPPTDRPSYNWLKIEECRDLQDIFDLVKKRYGIKHLYVAKLLTPWNAHPQGSLLLSETKELSDIFFMIDIPQKQYENPGSG